MHGMEANSMPGIELPPRRCYRKRRLTAWVRRCATHRHPGAWLNCRRPDEGKNGQFSKDREESE